MSDFHRIYAEHATQLYRYALVLSGNPAEAEDLVADTFVRLWAAPGEIREATIKAYLFTILRNLFRTRRRTAGREVPLDESVADPGRSTEDRTAAVLDMARLEIHMREMSDTDRRALLMRAAEGQSYEQIGASLGLSAGAVRVRVHRARAQLARALGRKVGMTS
jgi:RNA polymerase sigma-70 factor (ECF subfamily)